MHCLAMAGKHFNNTEAITWQVFGKWVPTATDKHVTVKVLLIYNNGNCVLYVVHAKC